MEQLMIDLLKKYCAENELPYESADELYSLLRFKHDTLSEKHKIFLTTYITMWDAIDI